MEKVFIVYFESREGKRSACVEDNTQLPRMIDFARELYEGMSASDRQESRVIIVENTLAFEDEGKVVWTSDVDYDGWNPDKIEKLLSVERDVFEPWEFDAKEFHDRVAVYPQGEFLNMEKYLKEAIQAMREEGNDYMEKRYSESLNQLQKLSE